MSNFEEFDLFVQEYFTCDASIMCTNDIKSRTLEARRMISLHHTQNSDKNSRNSIFKKEDLLVLGEC
jgi:hypothetical protein